jgi:aminopeptidase N
LLSSLISSFYGPWKEFEFDETPPMSTYLLAFTISDFISMTSDDELKFAVYASSKEYRNMEFALGVGKGAIKALEEYTGHPYQLDKMDFIAIDDFLYGAMVKKSIHQIEIDRPINLFISPCRKIGVS